MVSSVALGLQMLIVSRWKHVTEGPVHLISTREPKEKGGWGGLNSFLNI